MMHTIHHIVSFIGSLVFINLQTSPIIQCNYQTAHLTIMSHSTHVHQQLHITMHAVVWAYSVGLSIYLSVSRMNSFRFTALDHDLIRFHIKH